METSRMTQDYVSPKIAAKKLGLSKKTIYRKIKLGEIPSKKIGNKTLRIPVSYFNN